MENRLFTLPKTGLGQTTDLLNLELMEHRIVSVGTGAPVLLNSGIRRTRIILFNYVDSPSIIYAGSSDVAAAGARRGIPVAVDSGVILDFADTIRLYAIAASATTDLLVVELF